MANELRVKVSAYALKNGVRHDFQHDKTFDVSASEPQADVRIIDVTTSEANLTLEHVGATPGIILITNLDSTNYIEYGPDNSGSIVKLARLDPGETDKLKLTSGATLRWVANSATVKVKLEAIEA